MPSLVIPESGLSLGSPQMTPFKPGSALPAVVGLSLTDGMIEEMIKCVQNGKEIQLSLGDRPSLHYGSKIQPLSKSPDPFTHELYHSFSSNPESPSKSAMPPLRPDPSKGVIKVQTKPHARFLAMFAPKKLNVPALTKSTPSTANNSASASNSNMASITAGTDAALAQLQSSLASENAKKQENTTKYIRDGAGLPAPGRRGGPAKVTSKSKFLSQNNRSLANDSTRSMPSSPALSGVGSPSLGPTSIPLSQQQAERAKATRKPVIHLLALNPMTERELGDKITSASTDDLKAVLQKVSDLNESTGKYELRKLFYKELDVWTYKYDTMEDRQRVIDSAVKQYDKMRLGTSDPEWDRLLTRGERGTGKCLSKLQAHLAQGQGQVQRAPKINVQKAEGSGRDIPLRDEDEEVFEDKSLSKIKGESMTRSVSQPPTAKSKKVIEKEAQAKRMLSKNTTKPAPKPATAKKEKPQKPGSRVLSSQFVSDSDEEPDEYLIPPKPAPKPSVKRSREEDGETSDSSIPLSKKVKKEAPTHRISDASQTSRTTNSSTYSSSSNKTKGNSPQKSSPLASSPPTNASEFENSSGGISSSASPAHHTSSSSTKNTRSPIHKRHQKSSSVASSVSSTSSQRRLRPEVVDLARRYRIFYPKYEALHKEVANLEGKNRRDLEKEEELLDMHDRLTKMKKDIMAGIIEAN